jgi:hypothetical protein
VTDPTDPPADFQQEWNAGDLGRGELVIELRFKLKAIKPGEVIRVHATDRGAPAGPPACCRMARGVLLHHDPGAELCCIRPGAKLVESLPNGTP